MNRSEPRTEPSVASEPKLVGSPRGEPVAEPDWTPSGEPDSIGTADEPFGVARAINEGSIPLARGRANGPVLGLAFSAEGGS